MSAPIPVIKVDVFTDRPFAGNPAVAVLDADGLSEAQMQGIAAEMNVAGTAFVTASTRGARRGARQLGAAGAAQARPEEVRRD